MPNIMPMHKRYEMQIANTVRKFTVYLSFISLYFVCGAVASVIVAAYAVGNLLWHVCATANNAATQIDGNPIPHHSNR